MRHADGETLLQPTELTTVAAYTHDEAAPRVLARLVLHLLSHRAPEEPLHRKNKMFIIVHTRLPSSYITKGHNRSR